jgi:hypothetical protein
MIQVLDGPDGPVTENEDMIKVGLDYYKTFFCYEARPKIILKHDFFTKVLTNRIAKIINRIISYHQSAFIRCRYIFSTSHEIIHEVHWKKYQGLVFNIDYEKAYNKVNLKFLYEGFRVERS